MLVLRSGAPSAPDVILLKFSLITVTMLAFATLASERAACGCVLMRPKAWAPVRRFRGMPSVAAGMALRAVLRFVHTPLSADAVSAHAHSARARVFLVKLFMYVSYFMIILSVDVFSEVSVFTM